MTYYADLTPYDYLPSSRVMLNIGWLDNAHCFPHGPSRNYFVEKLLQSAIDLSNITRGVHDCQICGTESPVRYPRVNGRPISVGTGEIHALTVTGQVLAAPSLIIHYVKDHGYLPPQEFCDAILDGRILIENGDD